ncbi:hypothetical protein EDB19DRAFT_1733364 [Suillus lakei]|nr:hypothetical protein EDB19DRAFT_1733364 [Suillus lakei]
MFKLTTRPILRHVLLLYFKVLIAQAAVNLCRSKHLGQISDELFMYRESITLHQYETRNMTHHRDLSLRLDLFLTNVYNFSLSRW